MSRWWRDEQHSFNENALREIWLSLHRRLDDPVTIYELHLWERAEVELKQSEWVSAYQHNPRFHQWLSMRYHCPPVPPRDFYTERIPDHCLNCPRMLRYFRWIYPIEKRYAPYTKEGTPVWWIIPCRHAPWILVKKQIRPLPQSREGCREYLRLKWGLAKEKEDITDDMIVKIPLGATGYEMIL